MGVIKMSRAHFDPLTTWESPWNHMTYFWHNDNETISEGECPCASSLDCIVPLPLTTICAVREVPRYYRRVEKKNRCRCAEIVAIKPPPWKNVLLSRNCGCERCSVSGSNKIKKCCDISERPKKELNSENKTSENLLRIKKTHQTLRYDPLSIEKWKEDAANDELVEMFRNIREAPSDNKNTRGLECSDVLSQCFDRCPLCKEGTSAFGFCQDCVPSSLTCISHHEQGQGIPFQIKQRLEPNHEKHATECAMFNTCGSLQTDPLDFFQEINNMSFQTEPCSLCTELNQPLSNFEIEGLTFPRETCEHFPQNGDIFNPLSWSSILPPLPAHAERQARSTGSVSFFSATLDVGEVIPQDVNVVLYANRVLVAEAVNHGPSGESIAAQFWDLPENVNAESLRCFLGDGKLTIVSFPLPLDFSWKFVSTPAALGPPKRVNFPCPFDP